VNLSVGKLSFQVIYKFLSKILDAVSCFHCFLCTPGYAIPYQVHKMFSVRSDAAMGISNMHEESLGVVTAVFNSVPKTCYMESQYIVFMYPQNKSTALKPGICGHHAVGPPVERVCLNVGADDHAQTMYFLSPPMKHNPITHANQFLMSMRASSLCCKARVPNRNVQKCLLTH
jgi:hypothetical protein